MFVFGLLVLLVINVSCYCSSNSSTLPIIGVLLEIQVPVLASVGLAGFLRRVSLRSLGAVFDLFATLG